MGSHLFGWMLEFNAEEVEKDSASSNAVKTEGILTTYIIC